MVPVGTEAEAGVAVCGVHHVLIILLELPHGSRILERQPVEAGRDDRFDFHRHPVNVLSLTGQVARIAAALRGRTIAVCRGIGLSSAFLFHSPEVQPPGNVFGDVTLDVGLDLLDAQGVVVTGIKILAEHRVSLRAVRQRGIVESAQGWITVG